MMTEPVRKTSLENKHLRNCDYFAIIPSCSHFKMLTKNSATGLVWALSKYILTVVCSSICVARIFQRGGHTVSKWGYSFLWTFSSWNVTAFSPPVLGYLVKKGLQGGVTGTPGPPLATPLVVNIRSQDSNQPDDLFQSRCVTPGFNSFSYLSLS